MKIKQLTPLIHFEVKKYDSTALLRASELKPRITTFIKNEFLHYYDGERKEEYKKLINNEKIFSKNRGCGYFKLRINPVQIKAKKRFVTYIGKKNQGNSLYQLGSYFGNAIAVDLEDVTIEVFSYIDTLKNLVEDAFKYFFVLYNLGARQTKGFGGFIVEGTTKEEFEKILKKKYKVIFTKDAQNPYEKILQEYQLLKSGTNRPYKKSYLFEYFANQNIGWEKRKIKESIQNHCPDAAKTILNLNRHAPHSKFKEYKYIRSLLGLASSVSFKTKDPKNSFRVIVTGNIEKFASPILFKIYGNTIYALPNPVPQEILNQKFTFKASKDCPNNTNLCTLPTPQSFDLEDFLRQYLHNRMGWRVL